MSNIAHKFGMWLAAASLTLAAAAAAPITYQVVIDTSSISGGSGYWLDLQLNPGNATSQALTAVITSFDVQGGSLASTPYPLGDVTGSPAPTLTISNSQPLNSFLDGLNAGSSISFILTLSGPAIDAPDGIATAGTTFGVLLYDADWAPVLTIDPSGLLGQIDVGMTGAAELTTFAQSDAAGPAISFTPYTLPDPATSGVPEPGTGMLVAGAAALLGIASGLRGGSSGTGSRIRANSQ